MKKFVDFFQKFYESQYSQQIQKLVSEKIPCGFCTPLTNKDFQINIVNQFRNMGINLTTLFTTEKDFQNVPNNLEIIQMVPPPPRIHTPKYVFGVEGYSFGVLVPWFLNHGIELIAIESSGSTHSLINLYIKHMSEIFDVYQNLIDEESRDALLGYILARISKRMSFFKFSNNIQYVLNGFVPKPGEVVIDCGVCDGSTSAMFADFGCRVIGFEMDSENFKIASKLAEKKNFTVENFGLGDEKKEVTYSHFDVNIGASKINSDGTLKAQLTTLDSYVQDHHLDSVDFIKMDTEGAELSILKGATNTITRFKPILALSAYHKPEDIFTLAQFIKSIRPDYEFAFRHYGSTCDNAPFVFSDYIRKFCRDLDLSLTMYSSSELVLFAR